MGAIVRQVVKRVLACVFRVVFRVRVEGVFSAVAGERLLVIANHESLLDGLLLGLFLPLDPVFVVHADVLRNRLFRLVLGLVDYLPVDTVSPMAMKRVVKLVELGRPVVIFPEGRLTVTGSLMKVYEGPAFVAARTGATILPVRVQGMARSFWGRTATTTPKCLFPQVTLSLLPLTRLPMPQGERARERRRKAGEGMRRLMQQMIFDSRRHLTLYGGLLEAMAIHGRGRRVLEDMGRVRYSYGDLLKMTLGLGRMVVRRSMPGECVGILMPNLAATVGMMIGTSACGRVPAMLNYKAGAAALQDACVAAKIRTVFSSRAFVRQAHLEADVAALQGIRVLYVEDLRGELGWLDRLWVLCGMLAPRSAEFASDPGVPAVVLFTSGSEGKPKGVVLSHDAVMANIAQIRAVIDISTEDTVLNALPLFHSFGLTAGSLLPLMTGAGLFLYPSPLHYRVIPELAYDRNCSVLFGTGTFLANYARCAHPYDFFHLRYVVAGAEKLTDVVRSQWFEKFGIRLLEGYGATETAPVLAVNTPMAYRAGTVGQFLPGIEHRLVPVSGIEQGGMLHVRGPNVMSGYYRCDAPGVLQAPVSTLGEGWYETGDVARVDDEGFVSIVGRVKRFAKVAGEMVSLEVVEKIAGEAVAGAAHGATTRPDGARGEAVVLFTTDPVVGRDALVEAARRLGVAEIAVPRQIVRVAELPLLGNGKVDYVSLKRMAEVAA